MGSGGPGLGRNPSKGENFRGLMGVRGLLLRRLGERSLGWKEKPSLMLSRTEGATYVKPEGRVVWTVHWCLPREVCVKLAHVLL